MTEIQLFGQTYSLQIEKTVSPVPKGFIENDSLILQVPEKMSGQMALANFYYSKLRPIVTELTQYYASKLDVPVPKIQIKKVRSYWGECYSRRGLIIYNIELARVRRELIEYVVVHECCHLVEANHSSAFWKLVFRYCPNYPLYRKELKSIRLTPQL